MNTWVMIALALVPSASLVGIALVVGNFDVAGQAGLRWLIDAAAVVGTGLLVLGIKRAYVQRRGMVL